MRFAYIDSQGREVNIPSVDALRLRIELGAIKDTTEFFDANSGKWAPAGEHEIYKTLQRELSELESGGFVPPPPVPETAAPEAPGDAPAGVEESSDDGGLGDLEPGSAVEPAPADGGEAPSDDFGLGFDLELSDDLDLQPGSEIPGAGEVATPSDPDVTAAADVDLGDDLGLDAGGDLDLGAGEDLDLEGAGDLELGPDLGWDAGDLTEDPSPPREEAAAAGPASEGPGMANLDELASMELSDEWGEGDDGGAVGDQPDHDPATADMGGLDLEPVAGDETWSPPPPPPDDAGLSLEQPLSEFDADQPPTWMQESGSEAEEGEATLPPPPPRERGEPPARPQSRPRSAPPQRKLRKASTPGIGRLVLLAAIVVAVGAGGWYAYTNFLTGAGPIGRAAGPELPDLDPQLMPQMRQFANAAGEEMVASLAVLPAREQLPEPPGQDWLGSSYLANASSFSEVAAYWDGILGYVAAVQANADARFEAALAEQVQAANLSAANAEQVSARALAGWEAAAPDRQLIYDQLRQVATASLNLHEFLVANEAQIDEPQGVSEDRVLDAVPATEALREAMRERVLAITLALDNLGYLDQITTDALLGTFLEKLEATPIR